MQEKPRGAAREYSEHVCDVIIIGAGAAGLRTAIELVGQQVSCLVVGKRRHGDAHTTMAAGGINAALGSLDPEDRWEVHAADTIGEGHHVCQPDAVELLACNAPAHIEELVAWGCPFSRTESGEINQRYFGAQTYRRTCFVGDTTGDSILKTLVERAEKLQVPHMENVFITEILVQDGRAVGALGFERESGEYHLFRARAVVLAAGGYTALYGRSSSRHDENVGDATGLAYAAGAVLRDMEFVQFHPTGMVSPPALRGRLVTEAVRGEGGHLFNETGERFMERYSPEKMELDARDVVARAIYEEIRAGRGTEERAVLLDISHKGADFIRERLPKIHAQFLEQGIDITEAPMPVAPTGHYAMGGVKVDFKTGASSVAGLFAVGEASAGLHGANRLGGNSLAETLVFGKITGAHLARLMGGDAAPPVREIAAESVEARFQALERRCTAEGAHEPGELVEALRQLMWEHAGIVRSGEGLRQGLEELRDVVEQAAHLDLRAGASACEWALNLPFMLHSAEAILRGALLREESRGAHYREDAPESDPVWRKNILCAKEPDGGMRLWTEDVPATPPEIQAVLDEGRSLDYHHLE